MLRASVCAQRIGEGHAKKAFDALILVAPPHFLGLLRKNIDAASMKCVKASIHKEFTQLDDETIRQRLADHL